MGNLKHSLDPGNGVIRVTGEGAYTLKQVTEHFAALAETVARTRSERGFVKILIDTSKGAVQTAEVADKIESATKAMYGPDDRVALIAGSMLHKVQMRRVTDSRITSLFRSESAALTWLCAYDDARTSRHPYIPSSASSQDGMVADVTSRAGSTAGVAATSDGRSRQVSHRF